MLEIKDLHRILCSGYSIELSCSDDSNEPPQQVLKDNECI